MAQLNKRSFVTSSDAQTLVNRATRNVYLKLAETLTRGEIDESIRFALDSLDLSSYSTTDEITAAIAEAIEDVMTSGTMSLSSYSTTTEITAAITEAVADLLTDDEIAVLIQDAIDSLDLSDYSTTAQMNTAIAAAITTAVADFLTESQIDTVIATAIADIDDIDLSDYSTTVSITTAIATAIEDFLTSDEIETLIQGTLDLTDYSTTDEITTAIAAAIAGLVNFEVHNVSEIRTTIADEDLIVFSNESSDGDLNTVIAFEDLQNKILEAVNTAITEAIVDLLTDDEIDTVIADAIGDLVNFKVHDIDEIRTSIADDDLTVFSNESSPNDPNTVITFANLQSEILGDIVRAFVGATINGSNITLTRKSGENPVTITIPSGDMADGVVVSASINTTNQNVTLTTSEGDDVVINMSVLLTSYRTAAQVTTEIENRYTDDEKDKLADLANFQVHDISDIRTTISDDDLMVFSNESSAGDPNTVIAFEDLRDKLAEAIDVDAIIDTATFVIHDIIEVRTSIANDDLVPFSNESSPDDPNTVITFDNFKSDVLDDVDLSGYSTTAAITTAIATAIADIPEGGFDIHDDIQRLRTDITDSDRIPYSDESSSGDPNTVTTFANLRDKILESVADVDLSDYLTEAQVDARARVRYTDAEKTKLGDIPEMASGVWSISNTGDGTLTQATGTWESLGEIVKFQANFRVALSDDWREAEPILSLPDGSQCEAVNGDAQSVTGEFLARVEDQDNYTLEAIQYVHTQSRGTVYARQILGLFLSDDETRIVRPGLLQSGSAEYPRGWVQELTSRIPSGVSSAGTFNIGNTLDFMFHYSNRVYFENNGILSSAPISATGALSSSNYGNVNSQDFGNVKQAATTDGTLYILQHDDSILYSYNGTITASVTFTEVCTMDREFDGICGGWLSTNEGNRLVGIVTGATDPLDDGFYVINTADGSTLQINNFRDFNIYGFVHDGMIYAIDRSDDGDEDEPRSRHIVRFFPSETTTVTLVDPDSEFTPAEGYIDESSNKLRVNLRKTVEDENDVIVRVQGSYRKVA